MEVLRWLLFFGIALFLIVAGIFFIMGRPLPIPRFWRLTRGRAWCS